MGLFDHGITESISKAIDTMATKNAKAIHDGFVAAAHIISDRLEKIAVDDREHNHVHRDD